ncbi:MAG: hypothetical protein JW973_06775 [Bacteroidales bacterium]|nr:hypothetical protein [Bacteroidales bacterium]
MKPFNYLMSGACCYFAGIRSTVMKYIEQYQQLKDLFDLSKDEILIPESRLRIMNFDYQSSLKMPADYAGYKEDSQIPENIHFRYPVFVPKGKVRFTEAIIFLHGLNERTWHKHLTGAHVLAERTGKAVIMFPLSFHINRGLAEWSDSRKMAGLLEIRKKLYPRVTEASIVNLALSERLTRYPQRFFLSGLQSITDLIGLLKKIKQGDHPLFEPQAKTDIFAYSISCMLLQSLMLSNASSILNRSKIVFFAGGALFSHLQGISKFILDSVAFEAIRKFYVDSVEKQINFRGDKGFQDSMMKYNFGKAFRAIISPNILKKEREMKLAGFTDNLMVIALRDDRIMPVEGIKQAIGEKFFRSKRFKIVHFPYSYTHENPFPVLYPKIEEQVKKSFMRVYDLAVGFYNGEKQVNFEYSDNEYVNSGQ